MGTSVKHNNTAKTTTLNSFLPVDDTVWFGPWTLHECGGQNIRNYFQ